MSLGNVADVQVDQTLAPAARTATANGSSVRSGREGYPRAAHFHLGLYTDGTHTFTFEDSPDGSSWTALTASQLAFPSGLATGVEVGASIVIDNVAEDNTSFKVGLLSEEDYTRVVHTVAGGPSTGLVSGVDIETGPPLRAAGGAGQPMSASGYQRTQPSI